MGKRPFCLKKLFFQLTKPIILHLFVDLLNCHKILDYLQLENFHCLSLFEILLIKMISSICIVAAPKFSPPVQIIDTRKIDS